MFANAWLFRQTSITQQEAFLGSELQEHVPTNGPSPAFVEEMREQERIDKIIPDKSVTDEEISYLLSGEAEVLKNGVLG